MYLNSTNMNPFYYKINYYNEGNLATHFINTI